MPDQQSVYDAVKEAANLHGQILSSAQTGADETAKAKAQRLAAQQAQPPAEPAT